MRKVNGYLGQGGMGVPVSMRVIMRRSPFAGCGPLPDRIQLICGRCSRQLHQDSACGGRGSGGETILRKRELRPMLVGGSPVLDHPGLAGPGVTG
jgi:hypothetical protein